MKRIHILVLFVLFCPCGVASAQTATPTEVAQQFVNLGQTLFKEGNYSAALENFQKAAQRLESLPDGVPPVLYRNIARCHDQMGEVQAAIANYQRFVDSSPNAPRLAKALRHAREAVTRLQRILDATALSFQIQPADAKVTFDGTPLAAIPKGNWRVSPGKHTLEVTAPAHQKKTVEIDVAVGSTVPLIIQLERTTPATPAPVTTPALTAASKPSAPVDNTLAYVFGGVAAVSYGVAIWAAIESDSLYNSPINQNPGPDQNSKTEESETMGNVAWAMAGVGTASAVLAILQWTGAPTQAAWVPSTDGKGAGLVWRTRF